MSTQTPTFSMIIRNLFYVLSASLKDILVTPVLYTFLLLKGELCHNVILRLLT